MVEPTLEGFVYVIVTLCLIVGIGGMIFGESKKPFIGLTAGIGWSAIYMFTPTHELEEAVKEASVSTFDLIMFLLMVMAIVEGGVHRGMMNGILRLINTTKKWKLMLIVGGMSFVLSAVLDNLTASVVMGTLVVKLMEKPENRVLFATLVIAAANAGGVPSAIGNTTSILLWVGGQLSLTTMFTSLILPSITFIGVIFLLYARKMQGDVKRPMDDQLDPELMRQDHTFDLSPREEWCMLGLVLVSISIIILAKLIFHIPPWIGGMLAFGFFFCVTWVLNKLKGDRFLAEYGVRSALKHVDENTVVMFGLLLPLISVAGYVGVLDDLSGAIIAAAQSVLGEERAIWGVATVMGLVSSVIPNTPLVAASQEMFNFEANHLFWQLLNYSTGVGGSLLPLGSAAGVVMMSRFRGDLTLATYIKTATPTLLLAYIAGLGVILLQQLFI